MRAAGVLLLVAPLLAGGCTRPAARSDQAGGPDQEARLLIEQGDYDAALARLGGADDPESLYLLGRAWAGKAASTRTGPATGLGPDERQALDFLERAVTARPDHAPAHLAIAALLEPHALAAARGGGPTGSGVGAARVLEAYGAAIQADPADAGAVEALIAFSMRCGRLNEAEAGFHELIRRDRENPDVLVRFGDFLAASRQDREGALGVYAQALIWRPDDAATRLKMADLHLDAAAESLERDAWAQAEVQLRNARKFVVEPATPQAARLRAMERALADASGRR